MDAGMPDGSPRYAKTAEQIKAVVARMLERRIKDPRLGFVTVTDVRMSGDGREATVFYTVLGDEDARDASAAALASATGVLRTAVGQNIGMKFTPSLVFVLDAMEDQAAQFDEALARAKELDAEIAERAAGASYAGDADPYKRAEDDDDEPSVG